MAYQKDSISDAVNSCTSHYFPWTINNNSAY